MTSDQIGRIREDEERRRRHRFSISYSTSTPTPTPNPTQDKIDAMNAIGDFNTSVLQSTNGNGGVYLDTSCTSPATLTNAEVLGFKTWGVNPPALTKNIVRIGTPTTPTTSAEWYKDFCTTNVVPQLIVKSTYDKFVRFYNGQLADANYETNPGGITSTANPIDIVIFFTFNFGTEDFEVCADLRWDGSVLQWSSNGLVGGNLNGSAAPALGENMVRLTIDSGGNAAMYLNGVSIATGSRTYSTTEIALGTSSHCLTMNFRGRWMKFGAFTAAELTTLTDNSNSLWPRTGTYPYPYKTNTYQATFNQWNGGTKTWEPGRNQTSVFQGGNGVEGTHKYFWVYWSSSDVTLFTAGNKLDQHYKIPGTIHIATITAGNTINSVSVDGVDNKTGKKCGYKKSFVEFVVQWVSFVWGSL